MDYRRRAWVDKAACVGLADVDVRAVCADCPVLQQCKVSALVNEKYEVYGGMTPSQRDRWRKKNPKKLKQYALIAMEQGWFDREFNCVPARTLSEIRDDQFFADRLQKKAEADRLYEKRQPRPPAESLTSVLARFREHASFGQELTSAHS